MAVEKRNRGLMIFLIVAASVLVAALGASAVLILRAANTGEIDRIMEYGTVAQGISVGDVDISGMTEQQAREATQHLATERMAATQLQFDVGGEIVTLGAQELGFETDYEAVIAEAVGFGRTGSYAQRSEALASLKDGGKAFEVSITADEANVSAALAALGAPFNVEVRDASFTFMPYGYFEDGTPHTVSSESYGKKTEVTGLVRLSEEQMPNPLRYQFWDNDEYVEDYIPADANVARFKYEEDQRGVKTDIGALTGLILKAVQNNDFDTVIEVPAEVTQPAVTLEQIKAQTQLVASWTSSYSEHDASGRVYNVAKMADIVGGTVLEPGVEWSINEVAGPRRVSTGWKEASGINGGVLVPDPGGGVCQVSSTLYNAAIRSGLEITDRTHHSIISDYIPIGLDATISTGGPDLKIKNVNDVPMYIVTYMDYDKQTLTVEIYGPTVVDPTYGDVILTYTSKRGSRGATPPVTTIYNTAVAPDGTPIAPGESLVYRKARASTSSTAYKHIFDLEGNELSKEVFEKFTYRSYTGIVYVNGPDPTMIQPTPSPDVTTAPDTGTGDNSGAGETLPDSNG